MKRLLFREAIAVLERLNQDESKEAINQITLVNALDGKPVQVVERFLQKALTSVCLTLGGERTILAGRYEEI